METNNSNTRECVGRKRKASSDTVYSQASKKPRYEKGDKVEKKTLSEITRAKITRKVRENSCDPNIYGELETADKLSPPFYDALGGLLALITPIGCALDEEREVLGHLLNTAMKHMEDAESTNVQQTETPATVEAERLPIIDTTREESLVFETRIIDFKTTDEESLLFEDKKNWPKFVKAMTEIAHEILEAQLEQATKVNAMIETVEEKKGKVKEIRRPLITDPLKRDIFKELEVDLKESIRKEADDEKAIRLLRDVIYKVLSCYVDDLRVLNAKCSVLECLWDVLLTKKNGGDEADDV